MEKTRIFFQLKTKITFLFLEVMQGFVNRVLCSSMIVPPAMPVDTQRRNMITVVFHGFVQRCNEFSSSHFFQKCSEICKDRFVFRLNRKHEPREEHF